jgi:hypothetical protein
MNEIMLTQVPELGHGCASKNGVCAVEVRAHHFQIHQDATHALFQFLMLVIDLQFHSEPASKPRCVLRATDKINWNVLQFIFVRPRHRHTNSK